MRLVVKGWFYVLHSCEQAREVGSDLRKPLCVRLQVLDQSRVRLAESPADIFENVSVTAELRATKRCTKKDSPDRLRGHFICAPGVGVLSGQGMRANEATKRMAYEDDGTRLLHT